MTGPFPANVTGELVDRVEPVHLEQALGEAERHRRIVGPLARLEVEGTAAEHVFDWRERAGRLEFEGGSERVTRGKAEHRAEVPVRERRLARGNVRHGGLLLAPTRRCSDAVRRFPV